MAKEGAYFIKVLSPRQTRRTILEDTRDVLKILQEYEDYKKVRDHKNHLINSFKTNIMETKDLLDDLKKILPKSGIKEVKTVVHQNAQKPVKELKKLEQELSEIESKLNEI